MTLATIALDPDQVAFLDVARVAVVATVSEAGTPNQATVWYRLEPDGTIMLNARAARHWAGNARRSGKVSLAVLDAADGYRWLGLVCEVVAIDDDRARALADIVALHARYHDGEVGPGVEASFATHPRVTIRVRPTRVHDHLGDE